MLLVNPVDPKETTEMQFSRQGKNIRDGNDKVQDKPDRGDENPGTKKW